MTVHTVFSCLHIVGRIAVAEPIWENLIENGLFYPLRLPVICQKHKVGWYLFCLVAESFWGDIHGVIYPDGTVRDPSIVAAMLGFFRNRDVNAQPYYANKEGFGFTAVEAVREALDTHQVALFHAKKKTTDDILEAAEKCANLLEAAQLVSMDNPPSAKLLYFRSLPEEKRNLQEIRKFAYELAELVKEKCHIV